MSETLERILEEVKTLSEDERRQLTSALNALSEAEPGAPSERAFENRLEAEGWVSLPKPLSGDQASAQLVAPLISCTQCLSEILVEERR